MAYLNTYAPHGLTLQQTITATGYSSVTIPTGITWAYAIVVGGGGSGANNYSGGGGGVTAGWVYVKTTMHCFVGAGNSAGAGGGNINVSGFSNLVAGYGGGGGANNGIIGGGGYGFGTTTSGTPGGPGSTSYWGNPGTTATNGQATGGYSAPGGGNQAGFGQTGGNGMAAGGGGSAGTSTPNAGGEGWISRFGGIIFTGILFLQ